MYVSVHVKRTIHRNNARIRYLQFSCLSSTQSSLTRYTGTLFLIIPFTTHSQRSVNMHLRLLITSIHLEHELRHSLSRLNSDAPVFYIIMNKERRGGLKADSPFSRLHH